MSHKKDEDLEMNGGEELGERESFHHRGSILTQLENNPAAAVLAYCFSSISMTVVNKYVVSGSSWNLNFLYLAIQVCAAIAHQDREADLFGSPLFAWLQYWP
jgi:GDP-mannose transporter